MTLQSPEQVNIGRDLGIGSEYITDKRRGGS